MSQLSPVDGHHDRCTDVRRVDMVPRSVCDVKGSLSSRQGVVSPDVEYRASGRLCIQTPTGLGETGRPVRGTLGLAGANEVWTGYRPATQLAPGVDRMPRLPLLGAMGGSRRRRRRRFLDGQMARWPGFEGRERGEGSGPREKKRWPTGGRWRGGTSHSKHRERRALVAHTPPSQPPIPPTPPTHRPPYPPCPPPTPRTHPRTHTHPHHPVSIPQTALFVLDASVVSHIAHSHPSLLSSSPHLSPPLISPLNCVALSLPPPFPLSPTPLLLYHNPTPQSSPPVITRRRSCPDSSPPSNRPLAPCARTKCRSSLARDYRRLILLPVPIWHTCMTSSSNMLKGVKVRRRLQTAGGRRSSARHRSP